MSGPGTPRLSPLAVAAAAAGALAVPLVPSLLGMAALSDIAGSGGSRRGTGLARAGVVLGVLWFLVEGAAVGVFLARPDPVLRRLYRERIEAGEASAVHGLRLVVRQQMASREADLDGNGVQDYWTRDIAGLYEIQMERRGRPEHMGVDVAAADSNPISGKHPVPREGYLFRTVPAGDSLLHFAATAYPRTRGEDGFMTFYVDERGTIWKRDLGGAAMDRRMEDPAAEGWTEAGG